MLNENDRLLSREEAAEFLGVSKGTLEVWASTKRYKLSYVKVGRLPKYWLSELHRFAKERTISNEQAGM